MTLAGLVVLTIIPVAIVTGLRAGRYDSRNGGINGLVAGFMGVTIYAVLVTLLAAAL